MTERPIIVLFRQDLRLIDNRALAAAAASKRPVVPLYILDDETSGIRPMGGASRWWLHGSLSSLGRSLDELGTPLTLRRGSSEDVLADLLGELGGADIYATRAYEPGSIRLEHTLKTLANAHGCDFKRFPGSLLFEPEDIKTKSGDPYRVFTPFWRMLQSLPSPRQPLPAPSRLIGLGNTPKSEALSGWKLLPTQPDWSSGLVADWTTGEAAAHRRLDAFLGEAVVDYKTQRDRPDRAGTSRLSPHLHFGEISPNQCWHTALAWAAKSAQARQGVDSFLREIAWREFSYHLLFHFPEIITQPFRAEFGSFPWREDNSALLAWQQGRTGYPMVDAGMRELWTTGWMHNRVRMICASFLTKHLLIHWQEGERWFWDTLVDADLANNVCSWQWVAGSGADAAPYFRIFNPERQGTSYDPNGDYVRKWIPEIARLPDAHIHAPYGATAEVLQAAGIALGTTYPHPIVVHSSARARALAAYEVIK